MQPEIINSKLVYMAFFFLYFLYVSYPLRTQWVKLLLKTPNIFCLFVLIQWTRSSNVHSWNISNILPLIVKFRTPRKIQYPQNYTNPYTQSLKYLKTLFGCEYISDRKFRFIKKLCFAKVNHNIDWRKQNEKSRFFLILWMKLCTMNEWMIKWNFYTFFRFEKKNFLHTSHRHSVLC